MVDDKKASQKAGASTSAMERRRHVAWILMLIAADVAGVIEAQRLNR